MEESHVVTSQILLTLGGAGQARAVVSNQVVLGLCICIYRGGQIVELPFTSMVWDAMFTRCPKDSISVMHSVQEMVASLGAPAERLRRQSKEYINISLSALTDN